MDPWTVLRSKKYRKPWLLRVVVGLAFLAAGGSKLAGAPAMVAMFAKIGFGQWFRILTGLLEVTAAIALFVPRYTLYAAATLAVVMESAIGFHLTILGGNPSPRLFFFFSQALSLG
jgi:putative oxidoreductase